ncbi:hypothetical protein L2E82_51645 [Cichorium intybus]|nr:hypothetical protein L2E82_51645 [Cichorium intybus]
MNMYVQSATLVFAAVLCLSCARPSPTTEIHPSAPDSYERNVTTEAPSPIQSLDECTQMIADPQQHYGKAFNSTDPLGPACDVQCTGKCNEEACKTCCPTLCKLAKFGNNTSVGAPYP